MTRLLLLLLCLVLGAGCATRPFPPPNPQAKIFSGQMHYAGKERSFVGDFTARVSPTDFQINVAKGPGVTLLSVRTSGKHLARFEGAGRKWQGNPQHFVPGQLRSWLALQDVFLGRPNPQARVTRRGGQLIAEFPGSGERFTFQL